MKNIAIYGAGGFGKEIACLLKRINEKNVLWNFIGFFDDGKQKGDYISHLGQVIGNINDLNNYSEELAIVIALGNSAILQKIVRSVKNDKIFYPNIIDPNVRLVDESTFRIGKGNIIQSSCIMSCNTAIGDFNVLNGSITLGHDASIGNFNILMPSTKISGEVTIGNGNFFGVSSIILQQVRIGDNFRIGAGSVLMVSPKKEGTYIGNPAKRFVY